MDLEARAIGPARERIDRYLCLRDQIETKNRHRSSRPSGDLLPQTSRWPYLRVPRRDDHGKLTSSLAQ